ncbi:MAG: hypothetical protein KJZ93_17735 [Caldilineaceae bacterium]|nr:hypothetical protein [Caldilineaceae bacterium]
MPTCLLDKNVVRRAIEGIGKTQIGYQLTNEELAALRFLLAAEQGQLLLFISIEMQHILDRFGEHPDVQVVHRFVQVLRPARYFKRWARRLRTHGFTREDAKVLALATFGVDPATNALGVEQIATFDQPMVHHVAYLQDRLTHRLKAMAVQLPTPYALARLPVVRSPHDFQ